MAYTLQQLSDFEDIRTLKHRYYRGIDTADVALLDTLFTDDVTVDYRGGDYRVTVSGRADMVEFLANSFHSGFVGMHHGHMPDLTLTGDDTAEGIWYLEDIAIRLEQNIFTIGSAIYRDRYVRQDGRWKIAHTEYDRVMEVERPVREDERIVVHYLADKGRKPHERADISHLIRWTEPA
ncbi:nuclear transport factor 2 family protein [Sphingomonas jatrophae]|uniref:SnoaL-like domain-containing protein n=1 Tax=Sphingomonas jatrophae TaxID=1166337 RepID=A0A1I6KI50_9SPHN|nr:nuclear transport factor 2 family protein [Sphingomonas jatrophae]SFR90903.1 SnoaL-like domain-containing protein [Sphingomonas jatrophae]